MISPASDPILTQVEGSTLIITLNRPSARNAVNLALAEALAAALDRLDRDDALLVGIITGANGTFCSGMDLKAFVDGERPVIGTKGFAGFVSQPPEKPLIAAVDGYALAGGMEIALACDLIVANENASFGIPEVKRGLVAGAGGLMRLPRQLPYRIAMEIALTGEFLSARRASELGLVTRVVSGPAIDAARELARQIGSNGPLATRVTKRVLSESRMWDDESMWDKQDELVSGVFGSDDAREGALAFSEKRAPKWTGA